MHQYCATEAAKSKCLSLQRVKIHLKIFFASKDGAHLTLTPFHPYRLMNSCLGINTQSILTLREKERLQAV